MCLAVLESERACKLVNTRYVSELTSAGRRARDQMRIHGGTRAVGEQSGLTGGPTAMAIGGRHHSARGTGRIRTGSTYQTSCTSKLPLLPITISIGGRAIPGGLRESETRAVPVPQVERSGPDG